MTIREAIERLLRLERQHGSAVEVYFDCPWCGKSFKPDKTETAAVHLTADPKDVEPS